MKGFRYMNRFLPRAKLLLSIVFCLLLASCGLEGSSVEPTPNNPTTSNPTSNINLEDRGQFPDAHIHQAGNGSVIAPTGTGGGILESVGDRSIPAGAGLGQLANPTAPLGMKILIISATADETGVQAAEALMKQVGVPYDLLIASETPLTLDTLMNGTQGRYQGIILTTSGLSYDTGGGVFASAFDFNEWQTLWGYESDLNVRQLTLYTFPSVFPENYGIKGIDTDGNGFADGNANATTMTMTTEGQNIFSTLKADAIIPVKNAFKYPSVIDTDTASGISVTPLFTDSTSNNILGVLSTSADGRERMALTMGHNPFLLHTQLLGYDMLRWLTQGVFIGEKRNYLSIDVDDWYLESDIWDPATETNFDFEEKNYRITATDVYSTVENVLDLRERLNAPYFNYNQLFNGAKGDLSAAPDCKDSASLSSATLCTGSFFDFVSHTYTHAEMDFKTYEESKAEFEQNIKFGERAAINFDKEFAITGKFSGLGWYRFEDSPTGQSCVVDQIPSDEFCQFGLGASNREMLRAAADVGVKWLSANRGWTTHQRADGCDSCYVLHPLESRIKMVPRWPTNIFFNTTSPVENTSEFNYLYGPNGIVRDGNGNPFFTTNQNFQQTMEFEASVALRHILSNSPFPHYVHQNNLKEYTDGRNLLFDWSEAVLTEYNKYLRVPVISQDWEGITSTLTRRTDFFEALKADAIEGTWNRVNNTVSVSTNRNTTVYVTGAALAGSTQWTYGSDLVSRKALGSGQSVAGSKFTVGANVAPTLASIANQSNPELRPVSLSLSFADANKDMLRFSATNLPPGLAIDPVTGTISGTPACDVTGSYNVTVTVSDGKTSTQRSFTWTITALPVISVFNADFEGNMDGFSYRDDIFNGTDEPYFASGDRDRPDDYVWTLLGGRNNTNVNGMSGGFERNFNLNKSGKVSVSLKYRIQQNNAYEEDEYVDALVSIDGKLVKVNGQERLERTSGGGDTGWKTVTVPLGLLTAGNHQIRIGGFNNKKTYYNESAKISFDDVKVTLKEAPVPAPLTPVTPTVPDLTGNWVGYYSCYGCGNETISIAQSGNNVVATKVTGDNYVPAGEVTWKADVVTKAGFGKIAYWGYRYPRFVSGTLTIVDEDTIRFTWDGYGTITFNRTP